MSRYRKVDPRIWNDAKFRALSNKGKLVFFMLLTHPAMTSLGAMRGTTSGLAEELGWPVEAFREAFADVMAQGMAEHDSKACLIALPNFVRYNLPESPNVVRAWVGALDLLPECDLKQVVLQRVKGIAESMQEGFGKAFREAFAKAMPYQEQEPEPEQKQEPKKKTPPPPADAGGALDGFERFWTTWPAHPRKVAKSQCQAKWVKKGCEPIAETVIAAVLEAARSEAWRKDAGEFIPAPLVWLNQDRWTAPAPSAPSITVPSDEAADDYLARQRAERDAESRRIGTPEEQAARAAEARALLGRTLKPVVGTIAS